VGVVVAGARDRRQGGVELGAERGVLEAQVAHVLERDAAQPFGPGERQQRAGVAVAGRGALDVDEGAGDGLLGGLDPERFAPRLREQLGERRVAREVERVAAEDARERVAGAVAHRAHGAAVEVLEDQALEQVVHVAGGDPQDHVLVADDGTAVFEVADAGREEHDAGDRQLHRRSGVLGRGRGRHEDEDQRCQRAEDRALSVHAPMLRPMHEGWTVLARGGVHLPLAGAARMMAPWRPWCSTT
jgi:hypothetical protein